MTDWYRTRDDQPDRPNLEHSDAPAADSGIDAIVTLSRDGSSGRYAVVAKDTMTLGALTAGTPSSARYPLLVVGSRVNRRSAAALRDAGIQFIDTQGNAFLTFGSVLIEVQGRTGHEASIPSISDMPGRSSNLFSTRRSQVILALLAWPELRQEKVRDIASSAGVSIGQAHDALKRLEQAGFLTPAPRQLLRADELLDYWTAAYPAGLGKNLEIASYHGDPAKPVRVLDDKDQIFLSSESADGTDIARPATLTFYIPTMNPKLPIANRWSSNPGHPANVFVRQKFWTSPRVATDGRNAPWPLVYADLLATKDARLRETATNWREACSI